VSSEHGRRPTPEDTPERCGGPLLPSEERAMPIYMQYAGIDGDVTEEKHKKWVDVSHFSIGVGRAINSPIGSTAKREVSTPNVTEVNIDKKMDISSYRWLEESLYGQKAVKCTVHFTRTGQDGSTEVYAEYIFENCLVSGYEVDTTGAGATEKVSINFTKLEYTYTDRDAGNAPGGAKPRAAYDLSAAKKA
jgi:type VI secretion system secreted protein Hcp